MTSPTADELARLARGMSVMWKDETFEVAYSFGPVPKAGYTYRGLGLFMVVKASKKGRRPPLWSLTHLGSGHRLALIEGDVRTAFPIATEIAESGDWDFLSLEGWKDRFPDAPERLRELCERYGKMVKYFAAARPTGQHSSAQRDVAMKITMNRP